MNYHLMIIIIKQIYNIYWLPDCHNCSFCLTHNDNRSESSSDDSDDDDFDFMPIIIGLYSICICLFVFFACMSSAFVLLYEKLTLGKNVMWNDSLFWHNHTQLVIFY